MVLIKNWKLFHLFISGKIGQENVFHGLLQRKNAFLDHKNKKLRNKKMGIFRKGLVHGFGKNVQNFPSFSFSKTRPGKCV